MNTDQKTKFEALGREAGGGMALDDFIDTISGIVIELRICEVAHIALRPDVVYTFTVAPDCAGCVEYARKYYPETLK